MTQAELPARAQCLVITTRQEAVFIVHLSAQTQLHHQTCLIVAYGRVAHRINSIRK